MITTDLLFPLRWRLRPPSTSPKSVGERQLRGRFLLWFTEVRVDTNFFVQKEKISWYWGMSEWTWRSRNRQTHIEWKVSKTKAIWKKGDSIPITNWSKLPTPFLQGLQIKYDFGSIYFFRAPFLSNLVIFPIDLKIENFLRLQNFASKRNTNGHSNSHKNLLWNL